MPMPSKKPRQPPRPKPSGGKAKTKPASRRDPVVRRRRVETAKTTPAAKAVPLEKAAPRPEKPRPATTALARQTPLPVETQPVPRAPGGIFPIELDTTELEQSLSKMAGELKHWANKGRYTKVRFKFRGKQLLPDLPLAAVVAAEGLSFYWGGILRALLVNVAGGSLLQVELVNDADKKVQLGREQLLSGDVDAALTLFNQAIAMDRDNPRAHLNAGVALKLKGEPGRARELLEKARALDPNGPTGLEAEKVLKTLTAPVAAPPAS
jgi:hypothetical protein